MAIWSPPGQQADTGRWRYDLGKRRFTPPGVPSPLQNTQVNLPHGFDSARGPGFHMLASPEGTQAPVEHINYTPETGEVHGRGVPAPIDKLNYTLMPAAGAGHSSAGGFYGGGAGQEGPMPGSPPLRSSPSLMGPSPTQSRDAPPWGGGNRPFFSRMGMGADDDDLFASQSPTQAATAAQTGGGGTSPPSGGTPPPADQVQGPNTPGQSIPFYDPTTGDLMGHYVVGPDPGFGQKPTVTWVADPKYKDKTPPTPSYQKLPDGSILVITPNQADPTKPIVARATNPDPTTVATAEADARKSKADADLAELKAAQAKATSPEEKAKLDLEVKEAQLKVDQANVDLQQKQVDLQKAQHPALSGQQLTQIGQNGNIWIYNQQTGEFEDKGFKPLQQEGWTNPYKGDDGSTQVYNTITGEVRIISPPDPQKQNPPMAVKGGYIQYDPQAKGYKQVWKDSPDYDTTWRDGSLIAVNKQNPADTKVVYKGDPTMSEADAHTRAIDEHNQAMETLKETRQRLRNGTINEATARLTLEQSMQGLLHPQPFALGRSFVLPPGTSANITHFGGAVTHEEGGPLDPRIAQLGEQIDQILGGLGPIEELNPPAPPQATNVLGGTAGAPVPTPAPDAAIRSQVNQTLGIPDLGGTLPAGQAGTAADPRLRTTGTPMQTFGPGGNTPFQPDVGSQVSRETQATEDPITSGVEGASAGEAEDQGGGDELDPEAFRTYGMGHAQMGAGLSGGPSVGWVPRPGPLTAARGPGWIGAGQTAPEDDERTTRVRSTLEMQRLRDQLLKQGRIEPGPYDPTMPADLWGLPMGGGQEGGGPNTNSPDYQAGYQAGIAASKAPGTPPLFVPQLQQPIPGAQDQSGMQGGQGYGAGQGMFDPLGPNVTPPPGVLGPNVTPSPGGRGPFITPGPRPPVGGHVPTPPTVGPGPTDQGTRWRGDLGKVVASQVNEPLGELLGYPELGSPEHEMEEPESYPTGVQGGFDQPETLPVDIRNPSKKLAPREPTDIRQPPNIRNLLKMLPGSTPGVEPEDIAETTPLSDPRARNEMEAERIRLGTMGVGQQQAYGTPPPQQQPMAPQGQREPLPRWLMLLLKRHPELLQLATGGPQPPMPMPGQPSPPVGGPMTPDQSQQPPMPPMGGGQDYDPNSPADLWGYDPIADARKNLDPMKPYQSWWALYGRHLRDVDRAASLEHERLQDMGGGQDLGAAGAAPAPPQPPPGGAPPGQGGAPVPPVNPGAVAGIGHRFGQQMNQGEPQHSGVDLQAPEGTPTQSPVDGLVEDVQHNPQGLGLTVIIRGADGSQHKLGHLKSTKAYRGMRVARGQSLGSEVGSTGLTTGAHLHWGMRDQNGQPQDPTPNLPPQMQQMPPVPGTEMMGPPGGNGGQAQQGAGGYGAGNVGWRPRRR